MRPSIPYMMRFDVQQLRDTCLLIRLYCCLVVAAAALPTGADSASSRGSNGSSSKSLLTARGSISCYSCLYYANRYVPISNKACITGESIDPVTCPPGFACKVTFLQDSQGTIVHASRSCEHSGSFRSPGKQVKVTLNARTTLYCRQHGCNNNWKGRESPLSEGAIATTGNSLHCWVGYGRRIDHQGFKLQACSQKILGLGGGNGSGKTAVCLLAQLTRQIEYQGRVYESAAYVADCVQHVSSVYGTNYPMFEYERACLTTNCNGGSAARRKLNTGLMSLAANRASSTGLAVIFLGIMMARVASLA